MSDINISVKTLNASYLSNNDNYNISNDDPSKNINNLNIAIIDGKLNIQWSDSSDLNWKSSILVKAKNYIPVSMYNEQILDTINIKNSYKMTPYIDDDIEPNTLYCYRIFTEFANDDEFYSGLKNIIFVYVYDMSSNNDVITAGSILLDSDHQFVTDIDIINWNNIQSEAIDISKKKYNTKPNDETYDNRPGIMLAIKDAIEQGKNAVFIPSGTWYISVLKPIYIPSNFIIYGIGTTSIIRAIVSTYSDSSNELYNTYCQNSIIAIGDPIKDSADAFADITTYGIRENIKICDLCIDGNIIDARPSQISDNQLWLGAYGLACVRVKNLIIENCVVKNTLNTGILCERNTNTTIDNCTITQCGIYGISGSSRNGISMVGYYGDNSKATRITNCDIYENGDIGIQYVYAPIIISNCHIYNNHTYGIEGDNSYSFTETQSDNIHGDIIITDNYIQNNNLVAINISQGNNQKVNITGNIIKDHKSILNFSQTSGGILNFTSNNISYITNNNLNGCIVLTCAQANISNNVFDNCVSSSTLFNINTNNIDLNIDNNIIKNTQVAKLIVFRGGNLKFSDNDIDLLKNYCKVISLWENFPNRLIINNNVIANLVGLLIDVPNSIDNFICSYLSVNDNFIYDCNSPSTILIYIIPTTLGEIKIFQITGNSLGMSDPSYKIGRFMELGSNLIVDYFNACNNYILDSLNVWGTSFKFDKEPLIKKMNNNYFNSNDAIDSKIDLATCDAEIESTFTQKLSSGDVISKSDVEKLISSVSTSDNVVLDVLDEYHRSKDYYTSGFYTGPVVTFIDDDGTNAFYNNYAQIFKNNNVRCSLAVITNNIGSNDYYMSLDKIIELQNDGFDILSHSSSHSYNVYGTDLMNVPEDTIATDMKNSQEYMIKNGLKGYDTLVWPYGCYGNYTLDIQLKMKGIARKYFKNAVDAQGNYNKEIIDNMLIQRPFLDISQNISYFETIVDNCQSNNGWLILGSHSFSTQSITTDYMDSIIKYVISKNIPIMTFSDAVKLKGNKVSIGDYKNVSGRVFIGHTGKTIIDEAPKVISCMISNSTSTNGYLLTNPITKYPTNISILIVDKAQDTITGNGGFLTTYNIGQYTQMYQEFVSLVDRRKFIRGWNGNNWDPWSEFQSKKFNFIPQYYTGTMNDPITKYDKNQVTIVQLSNTLDTFTTKGGLLETYHGEQMLSHQKFVNLDGRFFIRYWKGLDENGSWSSWKEATLV